jgi:hypothetical protein
MLASRIKCLTYSSFDEAYGNDGGRSHSSHSKSPARPLYAGNSYGSHDGHSHSTAGFRTTGWDTERRGSDLQSGHRFEYSTFPQTLEELELEHKREAMELARICDKEEDDENYKHREVLKLSQYFSKCFKIVTSRFMFHLLNIILVSEHVCN